MNSEERRQRLNEVISKGISVSQHFYTSLTHDVPDPVVRNHSWWAAVWERPNRQSWPYAESGLRGAQEEWDKSQEFVQNMQELAKEREAREAASQAERDVEREAQKQELTSKLTAELRRAYLDQPGTTEEGFQKALPELLEQRAREATLASLTEIQSPINASQILS